MPITERWLKNKMEITSFDDDLLDLSEFAKRLERFIDVEHHFVVGGLVPVSYTHLTLPTILLV